MLNTCPINKTFGENLFIKDTNIIKKYKQSPNNKNFKKSDYNYVTKFIKYKSNNEIDKIINKINTNLYTNSNEFLSYVKDNSFLSYDDSKLIKSPFLIFSNLVLFKVSFDK